MAMKETVKSLVTYFGICSLGAAFQAYKFFSGGGMFLGVASGGFAAAYMYVSVRLPQLLVESPTTVNGILAAACVFLSIGLLGSAYLRDVGSVIVNLVGLLINWYLFRNVRRLAGEARGPAATDTNK